jgi:hypothetical protein
VRIQISYLKVCTSTTSIGQKKIALDGNTCHFGKDKKKIWPVGRKITAPRCYVTSRRPTDVGPENPERLSLITNGPIMTAHSTTTQPDRRVVNRRHDPRAGEAQRGHFLTRPRKFFPTGNRTRRTRRCHHELLPLR